MVRIIKEDKNSNKLEFETEIKALQKIEIDEKYYPDEESSLTFKLYTDGTIDINKIQAYMEFDKYYPDNNITLKYVNFDDWFIDEYTGEEAWVSIKFKILSEKLLEKEDYEEIAESLIEYLTDSYLKVEVSGEVVYYNDEWDNYRETVYQSRHVDDEYKETAKVYVSSYNNPVQIEIIKSA